MPEISRFLGMIISMYFNDHAPPHFHVRYGSHKAIISIDDLRLLEGALPPRVLGLAVEWATIHRQELVEDWNLARERQSLRPIAPLE
jgi:hypothetical protein